MLYAPCLGTGSAQTEQHGIGGGTTSNQPPSATSSRRWALQCTSTQIAAAEDLRICIASCQAVPTSRAAPPGGWARAEHHDVRAPVCDGSPPGHSLEDRGVDEALPAVHDRVPRNLGHIGAGLEAGHQVFFVGKVCEQD